MKLRSTLIVVAGLSLGGTAFAGPNVALDQVPAQARATIERLTRGAVVDEIEKETKADGTVIFEVEYTKNGQEWELDVRPDGTVIKHEQD